MTWKQLFTSSIGKKLVMGFTGAFLISFLVVHAGINACIWANDGGIMFNKAAHFMEATIVIRILEVGLFAGIILHVIQGMTLEIQNKKKRSIGYQVPLGNRGSKWYSRSMGLLGTLILLFLIVHIKHFWLPNRLGGFANIHEIGLINYDGKEYHNLYGEMLMVFQSLAVVVVYVVGCISLAYHLMHGFYSAFRTFGLRNPRYVRIVHATGTAFSIIVPLAFAMMPVSIYLGWIQ